MSIRISQRTRAGDGALIVVLWSVVVLGGSDPGDLLAALPVPSAQARLDAATPSEESRTERPRRTEAASTARTPHEESSDPPAIAHAARMVDSATRRATSRTDSTLFTISSRPSAVVRSTSCELAVEESPWAPSHCSETRETGVKATVVAGVTRWTDEIEDIRAEMGLDAEDYPTAAVLALIAVESQGSAWRRKFQGSSFYGLLQMGAAAGTDIGLPDQGRETTKLLHGDGDLSLEYFFRYQRIYGYLVRDDLGHLSERIAVLWKMGPGSARTVRRRLRAGDSFDDAVTYATRHHNIWRGEDYLERVHSHLLAYRTWLEDRS
jgi:hypothetical protein